MNDARIQPPASPAAQRPWGARLARLWTYFSEYRLGWVLAIAGTLISALTEASVPALLKPLLDEGFTQGSLPIWTVPLAIVGLFALRGVAHFASQYALARIANEGMVKLRRQLFDRLLNADLALFSRQSASQLANTIVYEVQTGTTMLVQSLLNLGRDSFSVLALMGYLLYLNWSLTLIVLVLVPIVALIMKTMSRRLYRYTRLSQSTTDELAYVVEENVLAHRMVRLHGAQQQQAERFHTLSRALRGVSIKATSASAAAMPLAQMAAAVALSVVIAIALQQGQASGGRGMSVGGFVSFIGAMLMLIQPLRRLTDVVGPITRGLAALGVLLGISGWLGLLVAVTWLLVAFVSRYSSLAALVASIMAPIYYVLCSGMAWDAETPVTAAIVIMALLLIWRHRENIQRLMAGKESKLGQKKRDAAAAAAQAAAAQVAKPGRGKNKGRG